MKTIYPVILLGLLLNIAAAGFVLPNRAEASVAAAAANYAQRPLMIIRFNQRKVFYKRPLFTALSQAVATAPDIRFNVVSYVPASGDDTADQRALAVANAHVDDVVQQMQQMGIPSAQIFINSEMVPQADYDEIHIFVQ